LNTGTEQTQFLQAGQLRERWGVSHMFIERRLKNDPTFPTPYKFADGPSAWRYWRLDEIEAWERARVARRA
jgi:predicted DNA-binding transcriptional regulator AlpA